MFGSTTNLNQIKYRFVKIIFNNLSIFFIIFIIIIFNFINNITYNTMTTTVQQLFLKAFRAGREVQIKEHSGETVDGRLIWNELEQTTKKLKDMPFTKDGHILKYNMSLESIYREMNDIITHFGMDKSEFNPKSNHFFCQLMNLVDKKSNFEMKLNKIMQLGFNAGQLSIFLERKTLPVDRQDVITDFIQRNNMLELNTYVSAEKQEIINTIMNHPLNGGGGKYRSRRQNKRRPKSHRRFSHKKQNKSTI